MQAAGVISMQSDQMNISNIPIIKFDEIGIAITVKRT